MACQHLSALAFSDFIYCCLFYVALHFTLHLFLCLYDLVWYLFILPFYYTYYWGADQNHHNLNEIGQVARILGFYKEENYIYSFHTTFTAVVVTTKPRSGIYWEDF